MVSEPSSGMDVGGGGHGRLSNTVLSEALTDETERQRLGLPEQNDVPFPIVVELNFRYRQGLAAGIP